MTYIIITKICTILIADKGINFKYNYNGTVTYKIEDSSFKLLLSMAEKGLTINRQGRVFTAENFLIHKRCKIGSLFHSLT